MDTNIIYCGDNLEVLSKYIPDESVDLIYLDPPFNSKATYNVLFQEKSGEKSAAQITAFDDTWHWGIESEYAYEEVVKGSSRKLADLLQAMRTFLGQNDMMAYLVMMAQRMVELHRVLKPTGSIYLHCDPTASHYLKLIMDAVFGPLNFRNEIVWQKTRVEKAQSKQFAKLQDIILFYSKSEEYLFNQQRLLPSGEYTSKYYSQVEPETDRKYQLISFIQGGQGPARRFGDRLLEPPHGKHWIWSQDRIDKAMEEGLLVFTDPNKPRLKRYLDKHEGRNLGTIWSDIFPINAVAKERLGYPTQKPLSLLERIIKASSNEGQVVLDAFCGSGTTLEAAGLHKRKWIGIDYSPTACRVMLQRLEERLGLKEGLDFTLKDMPKTVEQLLEFQNWAVVALGGIPNKVKVGDYGIDGRLYLADISKERCGDFLFA